MNIHDFLKSLTIKERQQIAKQARISIQYVHQIANRRNNPSAEVARRIYLSRLNKNFNPPDMAISIDDYTDYLATLRKDRVKKK